MLANIYAMLISVTLIVGTVFIHYEVLTTRWPVEKQFTSVRRGMIRLLAAIFFAHVAEIVLYGAAYFLMHGHFGLGTLTGAMDGTVMDYMYFSAVSYTTLGFGDVIPAGPIRIVCAIESLNGLVLIGWSTSYTYLAMQRFSRAARRLHADLHPDAGVS
ncbi:two pore domain potassium channel family protein [Sphingomonas sabuli]|uniref:Two pore domain potassium channel family protein n=1 Tax=Sphingomonas sabuli TaxID=2764186 RepID=A0A7G9L4X1_9SPHN|nr:potassium channel family protein [Sphingomonas sabuli]QNM83670.1 two pore domain potassium channel family protein [Sphingomonas sabuli]